MKHERCGVSNGTVNRSTSIAACSGSCKEIPRIISIDDDHLSLDPYIKSCSAMDESIGSRSFLPKFIEFNELDQYDIVPLDESLEDDKVPSTNDYLLAELDVSRIFFNENDSEHFRINLFEI